MKILLILMTVLASAQVFAFPSTVRHGYTSCFTCHYSPTGGGVLKPYGKFVAGELYGQFNNSETELPWLTKTVAEPGQPIDEKFVAGVLIRGNQAHRETGSIKKARYVLMQADVELGYNWNKYYAFATAGLKGAAAYTALGGKETDFYNRRWYIGRGTQKYNFRVGKFYPDFGIRHPNHYTIPTRRGLYFDQGQETHAAQFHYYLEKFDIALTGFQYPEKTNFEDYKGYSATFTYKTPTTRTGVSYLSMKKDDDKESAYAVFNQFGFLHTMYVLTEYAYRTQERPADANSKNSYQAGYLEYGWEFMKGVIPFAGYSHYGLNKLSSTLVSGDYTNSYILGMRYYPLTHFEIVAQYSSDKFESNKEKSDGNTAFLMANIYF